MFKIPCLLHACYLTRNNNKQTSSEYARVETWRVLQYYVIVVWLVVYVKSERSDT